MSNLEKLIESERANSRSSVLYMLMGHFGDRLSKDIQDEIRTMAEQEQKRSEKLEKLVAKNLSK